ncbi:MAG: anaerobic ribonucleoside-triphosphate reductase, partial [Promethearchaeota archaeon]
ASNRISEEYSHLRILSNEESKAHLYGDIHIHKLRFFDLRPLTQIWDPRIILEHGLPPIKDYISCCKLKPAKNLREACDHLNKWLVLTQNEIGGCQGYINIITYLAPYVKESSQKDLNLIIKNFLYEMNYFSLITGRTFSPTTIMTHPSILKSLLKIPAVGPYGKIEGYYEDFYDECIRLFNSFTYNFKEGDDNNNPYNCPKHEVYIDNALLEDCRDAYHRVWDETSTMKTPILINSKNNGSADNYGKTISPSSYNNQGMLQEICMNLPRFAYLSIDEEAFTEMLKVKMNLSSRILLKKQDIIRRRLKSNHLPLFNGKIKDQSIFELENQRLAISFIGLNEAIKFLTDYELHEDSSAFNLGRKILFEMNKFCNEFSKINKVLCVLSENFSEKPLYRLAKLDLKHFPEVAIPQFNEKRYYYTNSAHFRDKIEIDIIEKAKNQEIYHQFIQSGAIEYFSLNKLKKSDLTLEDFIKRMILHSNLVRLKFVS